MGARGAKTTEEKNHIIGRFTTGGALLSSSSYLRPKSALKGEVRVLDSGNKEAEKKCIGYESVGGGSTKGPKQVQEIGV